jgi:hypothetical protein
MTKRIGIAAVFLVGCAVGGASSQLVVPKASAQQATLPVSEYLCLERGTDPEDLTSTANKLAAQRWDLTAIVSPAGLWCWKRPKM